MPRYALLIEYDGTPFVGWQLQDNGLAVQGVLEAALSSLDQRPVRVHGAGRTDTGVHALGQVAHIDLEKERTTDVVRDAVNALVRPHPVSVVVARQVPDTFDARFSAIGRHYLYRLNDRRAPSALDLTRVWHQTKRLDVAAMQAAAQVLVGHHDFTTFRASACQAKSPWRTLDRLDVVRSGDDISVTCSARSFLHNQVRSMVGSLRKVGEGQWTADDLRAALDARDRTACGPVAPAHGLYLTRVDYREGDGPMDAEPQAAAD
jgi:tRNA pseudouridine38-40 synthase